MGHSRDRQHHEVQRSEPNLPAPPNRAVGPHTGPPRQIDGEFRELAAESASQETTSPQQAPGISFLAQIKQSLGDPKQWAVLWAEGRRGLKDLQEVVLNPFPTQHVASHEEIGTIGSPTQHEVYNDRHHSPEATPDAGYADRMDAAVAQAKDAPEEPKRSGRHNHRDRSPEQDQDRGISR